MKYLVLGTFLLFFASCEKESKDKDLDLLVSKKWILVSSRLFENWEPVPDKEFDSSIAFEADGTYLSESYLNTAPRYYQPNSRFVQMGGTWNKDNKTIYFYDAKVFKLDNVAIKDDSLVFSYNLYHGGFYNKTDYDNSIVKNLQPSKWVIVFISQDSMILSDTFTDYKYISANKSN